MDQCFQEAYGNLLNFKHVPTFNQELIQGVRVERGLNEVLLSFIHKPLFRKCANLFSAIDDPIVTRRVTCAI